MKGAEIKKILLESGHKLKDIANAMDESPQNLNSMLNADDIKTGVLERIAVAAGRDMDFFFGSTTSGKKLTPLEDRYLTIIESQQRTIEALSLKGAVEDAKNVVKREERG